MKLLIDASAIHVECHGVGSADLLSKVCGFWF